MVTIKDIAQLAGVSQGTVSNVLNGKANVSSEKIRYVLDAANELGYIPNERAKLLRKGRSNILAVVLPNINAKQYINFYLSFKIYAENHGFSVIQYLTNDDSCGSEAKALQDIHSAMTAGIASISCCLSPTESNPYLDEKQILTDKVLFVERKPHFTAPYMGFDYEEAGIRFATEAVKQKYSNICLLTGNLELTNEADFYNGFTKTISGSGCNVNHIQTDSYRKLQNIFQMLSLSAPQAIFISNYGFAENVKDICDTFYQNTNPKLYTISPLFTMPENDFIKYELNYHHLGKNAAKYLISSISNDTPDSISDLTPEAFGIRNWFTNIIPTPHKSPLNVLTLDSPSAYTMRNLSRMYTQHTGAEVNVIIYSYDEIYEAFKNMGENSIFDVIRLDVTWLPWFANKILQPLDQIDSQISDIFKEFLNGVAAKYSIVDGQIFALPSTPSSMLLYYRRDLFESPVYKRMFMEMYKMPLEVPTTFEEFNRISRFFTKRANPLSPVDYGNTLTLGTTGVVGSEFLARLFSHQENLYDAQGKISLNSKLAIQSLNELIETKAYSDPNYCTWWTNTAECFSRGNVAMSILYNNYASTLLSHSSKIVGKIGYTMVPGGNPVIGGGSLGVSKYSTQPREALSFIKWLCSEPISSAATLLGGISPCKKSYDNYEIINSFPWLNLAKDCFVVAKGNRTPNASSTTFDERQFLNIIGISVKNAYHGIQSPTEALNQAQQYFENHLLEP